MMQAKRMLDNGGNYHVKLATIEKELAEYCHVTIHAVIAYKLGRATPSLPVALRMTRFFRCEVEDIFPLDYPNDEDDF
jgi:DNA-binding XRE family transcriptional regulator